MSSQLIDTNPNNNKQRMGSDNSKPAPKPDVNQAIFQLRMSSKRFLRESNRAQKEKEKNLKSAKASLLKGDEESARLYSITAQNNINDYKKYLRMSSRLDAIASSLKSNMGSADVMKHLAYNVNPILVKEADSMDLKELCHNFETFQEAFDKMAVNASIMGENFDKLTNEGNTVENADNLLNQLKNEVVFDKMKDSDSNAVLNTPQPVKNENKALDDYIEDLKKL